MRPQPEQCFPSRRCLDLRFRTDEDEDGDEEEDDDEDEECLEREPETRVPLIYHASAAR
jgi:hypothetical protein